MNECLHEPHQHESQLYESHSHHRMVLEASDGRKLFRLEIEFQGMSHRMLTIILPILFACVYPLYIDTHLLTYILHSFHNTCINTVTKSLSFTYPHPYSHITLF